MMKKSTKIWLIIAAAAVLIGSVLFAIVMSTLGWDISGLSTSKYETNKYEITESFNDISLTTDTADIEFILCDCANGEVECYEEKSAKHSVYVENNTLTIKADNAKPWYEYIGFHFDSPKITVYLPKGEYGELSIRESTGNIEIPSSFTFERADISASTGNVNYFAGARGSVKIKTSTGDIRAENSSVGSLDLSVTTGSVNLYGVNCKNLTSSGSTGNISLNSVVAEQDISIKRSTGNVTFDGSDASKIFVKTSTGNVTGSLLSDKDFIVSTSTGKIDVPKTTGDKCEITTSTGDVIMTVKPS